MTLARWLAAPALLLLAAEAPGQVFIGGSFGSGHRHRLSVTVAIGSPYVYAGPVYGYGYPAPYGVVGVRQVTVIYGPPPVVYAPPRLFLPDDFDRFDRDEPPRRPPAEPPRDFRPAPEPRRRPEPIPEPKKPEPKPAPRPELKPPRELPMPLDNPKAEAARLLERGRAAFAEQQYGRARERFAQAAEANPNEPLAFFLLAQDLVALGKYHEAVDAVHAGLALQPDWPTSAFRPLPLYGDHVQDYADHLRQAEATLAQHPADPVLLFLNAYLMWFDGRKDDARPLFRRARDRRADRGDVERFLRAGPGPEL
jgi:hypothetical protein